MSLSSQTIYFFHQIKGRIGGLINPLKNQRPLIVYQMGKVGSESLERSLVDSRIDRRLIRIHSLIDKHIDDSLELLGIDRPTYFQRSRQILESSRLAWELKRDLHKHRWQVISMIRDPVAQNISSFFQIIDLIVPNFEERLSRGHLDLDELMEHFLKHYSPDSLFANWFDDELKPAFDFDVFDHEFEPKCGFSVYEEPHISLLLIRLEDFDRVAETAVQEFLQHPGFRLIRSNQATDKSYGELYERFRSQAVFPRAYVDGMYEKPIAQHFYTSSEIERFRSKINVS